MRKTRVILFFILVLAFLLFGITGYNVYVIGKAREELSRTVLKHPTTVRNAKRHVIAILPLYIDPFISSILQGIQEEAETSQTAVQVFHYPSEGSTTGSYLPAEAFRYFDIAVRSAPDGLIMHFPAGEKVEQFIEKAERYRIPFVPMAMDVPLKPSRGFVTSDSFLQGREAASVAVGLLGKDAQLGVILPSGTPNSFTLAEEPFLKGAIFELDKRGKGKIVAVEREAVSILGGEEACITMLQNHPEINAFLCTSIRSTISVAQVIIDRGLVGKILIIGTNENTDIKRLLEKGVVQATIVRDALEMGRAAVRRLEQIWAGTPAMGIIKINSNTKFGRNL
ncbi:MAG: substrate-binding domain-containing protein [Spirochaetes bacterium]|nr:substrate-binding domain-containing protein [Spirochaetota bacterium]